MNFFLNYIHPDDLDYVKERWNAALKNEPYDIEHRIIVNDKIKWVNEKANIKFDTKGKPVMSIGFTQDITERKQAEQKLKEKNDEYYNLYEKYKTQNENLIIAKEKAEENKEKYKQLSNEFESILDHIPGLIFYKDTKNNLLRVNKYLAQAYNLSKSEIEGKSLYELHTKKEAEDYHNDDLEVINSRKAKLNIVEPWNTEKGNRWVSTSKIPFADKNGNITGIIGISIDITKRKQAEEKLIESEAKFKLLFNSANDAVFLVDMNEKFIEVNDEAVKQYGYSKKEFLSMGPINLSPPGLEMKVKKEIEAVQKNEKRLFRHKNKKADGTVFPVEISIRKIIYDNETVFLVLVHDISETEKTQQKILNAIIDTEERERKRIAEDLHDELGPFLSGIKLYIKELSYDDVDQEKRISIINYLKEFINEALEKTRSISNQLMPNVLLDYGLVKALNSFCNKINKLKTLKVKFTSNIPGKGYNKTLEVILYRISIELINNTIKHADAKKIKIDLNQTEEILQLTYCDDGKGFNLEKELKKEKGLGLTNMLNRLNTIKGKYEFESKPGKCIKIKIMIDLTQF